MRLHVLRVRFTGAYKFGSVRARDGIGSETIGYRRDKCNASRFGWINFGRPIHLEIQIVICAYRVLLRARLSTYVDTYFCSRCVYVRLLHADAHTYTCIFIYTNDPIMRIRLPCRTRRSPMSRFSLSFLSLSPSLTVSRSLRTTTNKNIDRKVAIEKKNRAAILRRGCRPTLCDICDFSRFSSLSDESRWDDLTVLYAVAARCGVYNVIWQRPIG